MNTKRLVIACVVVFLFVFGYNWVLHHDGLALHDPAEAVEQAGMRLADLDSGALAALRDLKEQGLLREIGVGSKEIDIVLELLRLYPGVFDYLMIMNYNLLDHYRCIEELIPRCQDKSS